MKEPRQVSFLFVTRTCTMTTTNACHNIFDADTSVYFNSSLTVSSLLLTGGFGLDFSFHTNSIQEAVRKVAHGILAHGVTSFCPTVVSSSPEVYHKVII